MATTRGGIALTLRRYQAKHALPRSGRAHLAVPVVVVVLLGLWVTGLHYTRDAPQAESLVVGTTPGSTTTGSATDPGVPASTLARSAPVRLGIPTIGVSATVHQLGLAPDGALEVPTGKRYDEAGWYTGSPAPGSLGPAVIVGHVDSAKDGPSVFFRLAKVKAGDAILVTRQDGSVARFVVDSVKSYRKTAFPTQLVYGNIDHAGLRLITCGGFFDRTAGSYTENVVLLAHLVAPTEAPAEGLLAQRTR